MRQQKQYLIRKYVTAVSVTDAIKKERSQDVDDVMLVPEKAPENYDSAIGFTVETEEEE